MAKIAITISKSTCLYSPLSGQILATPIQSGLLLMEIVDSPIDLSVLVLLVQ